MGEHVLDKSVNENMRQQVSKLEEEIHKICNKLKSEGYLSRVPAAIIEKEQSKLEQFQQACSDLKTKIRAVD